MSSFQWTPPILVPLALAFVVIVIAIVRVM
jgi:hypothetical protein